MKTIAFLAISAVAAVAVVSAQGPNDKPACDLAQVTTKIEALNSDVSFKQCKESTGYKFDLTESTPTEALMDKICASVPCASALQKLSQLNLGNCTIKEVTGNLPKTLAGYAKLCNKSA